MRLPSALLVSVALVGCATIVPKEPPTASAGDIRVSTRMPADAEIHAATPLKNSYFGASGATGSAAVGVAFGVLGVLANVAYINSENAKRAAPLTELTSMNLGKLLEGNTPKPLSAGGESSGYELVPSGQLIFRSPTTYVMACSITVHRKTPQVWQARYIVALDTLHDAEKAEDTARARASMPACLNTAQALFRDHISRTLGATEKKMLTMANPADPTKTFTYQQDIIVSALPGKVIVHDGLGLIQMRPSDVVEVK
jgi:hypothetical protein